MGKIWLPSPIAVTASITDVVCGIAVALQPRSTQ